MPDRREEELTKAEFENISHCSMVTVNFHKISLR